MKDHVGIGLMALIQLTIGVIALYGGPAGVIAFSFGAGGFLLCLTLVAYSDESDDGADADAKEDGT